MNKTIKCPKAPDKLKAISSKSEVHRLLIAAALSDKTTRIKCESINEDIRATAGCLQSLGARISYTDSSFTVEPITDPPENPELFCNESGSTLRFLLPLAAFYGKGCAFVTEGRLALRPLSPLKEELEKSGCIIKTEEKKITISGKCTENAFRIPGNVSSQFISGLLFMLTKTGGKIIITEAVESRPYIEMTIDVLRKFGCKIDFTDNEITIEKTCPLVSPLNTDSFGDWSNAAFFLSAGVIGKEKITVTGLDINSKQGDKKIIDILCSAGAKIDINGNEITAHPSVLHSFSTDASDTPDLVPVLTVVAANAEGTTKIYGCSRLRIKESDRIESVVKMITALGGKICADDDCIIVEGYPLSGGIVSSENDHRIAMSAAVAAFGTKNEITIENAQAVNKSYPSFWDEIR